MVALWLGWLCGCVVVVAVWWLCGCEVVVVEVTVRLGGLEWLFGRDGCEAKRREKETLVGTKTTSIRPPHPSTTSNTSEPQKNPKITIFFLKPPTKAS